MQDSTKKIYNKLLFSGIILFIILIMQPIEVWLFFRDNAMLFPKGLIALKQRNILFIVQVLMLLVIVPVYVFTFIFSWWYRADNEKSKYDPHLVDSTLAEFFWWGVPFVMVTIVAILTWIETHKLDPYKPLESEYPPIKIEVVALQWKWLFIYPEENIATINYIRIPKDIPINFIITADAPMNSLWIPRLGGQIYAMPGMRTELHLIANEEGKFRGSSANISGKGFAGMTFITEASTEESYLNWIKEVQQANKELNWDAYLELAKPSEYSPVEYFQLTDTELFRNIIMQYMKP